MIISVILYRLANHSFLLVLYTCMSEGINKFLSLLYQKLFTSVFINRKGYPLYHTQFMQELKCGVDREWFRIKKNSFSTNVEICEILQL